MVVLRWLQSHNPLQDQPPLFFSSLPLQIFERVFIRPDRQLFVRLLQQLPKADFLFPAWVGIPRQLLVGQARPRRLRRHHLPFKQLSQQPHRLRPFI